MKICLLACGAILIGISGYLYGKASVNIEIIKHAVLLENVVAQQIEYEKKVAGI